MQMRQNSKRQNTNVTRHKKEQIAHMTKHKCDKIQKANIQI